MKLGADPKRAAILGGLVLVGGYLFYDNVLSGPSASAPARPSPRAALTSPQPVSAPAAPQSTRRPSATSRSSEEFRPPFKARRPEDRVNPMAIDPTLRKDLLAKVQAVELQGGHRNLFQFSTAPPPPLPPEPKIKPNDKTKVADATPASSGPPKPPAPPPPPPILLKYYGYSSAKGDNRKRAFFLDGDEILVAMEGDLVKKRYRVVRIGVNSVVMEDTQFNHEQTLQLQEEAAG
jgi:hypothetical protein